MIRQTYKIVFGWRCSTFLEKAGGMHKTYVDGSLGSLNRLQMSAETSKYK